MEFLLQGQIESLDDRIRMLVVSGLQNEVPDIVLLQPLLDRVRSKFDSVVGDDLSNRDPLPSLLLQLLERL